MSPVAIESKRLYSQSNPSMPALVLQEIFRQLEGFEVNTRNSVCSLKPIFQNKETKKYLLKQVDSKDYVQFQTLWEGIKNLLKTIEKEKDSRAIKADRLLLNEDLAKIRRMFYEKLDFNVKCFKVEKNASNQL